MNVTDLAQRVKDAIYHLRNGGSEDPNVSAVEPPHGTVVICSPDRSVFAIIPAHDKLPRPELALAIASAGKLIADLWAALEQTIKERDAQAPVAALYQGNSAAHWHSKAKAYGDMVHAIIPALGLTPGYNQPLAPIIERIRKERDEACHVLGLIDCALSSGKRTGPGSNMNHEQTLQAIEFLHARTDQLQKERDDARKMHANGVFYEKQDLLIQLDISNATRIAAERALAKAVSERDGSRHLRESLFNNLIEPLRINIRVPDGVDLDVHVLKLRDERDQLTKDINELRHRLDREVRDNRHLKEQLHDTRTAMHTAIAEQSAGLIDRMKRLCHPVYIVSNEIPDTINLTPGKMMQSFQKPQPALPQDLIDLVRDLDPVEWGAVHEKSDAAHVADFASTLEKTRAHFKIEGPATMHGVYPVGTDFIIAKTGTSPNSAKHAQAIVALWNWARTIALSIPKAPAPQSVPK